MRLVMRQSTQHRPPHENNNRVGVSGAEWIIARMFTPAKNSALQLVNFSQVRMASNCSMAS